jgi:hypothetical protein
LEPAWGIGQVQSAVGNRVTVNFEHAGKKLINVALVRLASADDMAAAFSGPLYPNTAPPDSAKNG